MSPHDFRLSRHYLELRLVIIYGAVYFLSLAIGVTLFFFMMSGKFHHLIFWSWCLWSFITSYFFYLFMSSVMRPAVQIYPEFILLTYPKRRKILRSDIKAMQIDEEHFEVSYQENSLLQTEKIKLRRNDDS